MKNNVKFIDKFEYIDQIKFLKSQINDIFQEIKNIFYSDLIHHLTEINFDKINDLTNSFNDFNKLQIDQKCNYEQNYYHLSIIIQNYQNSVSNKFIKKGMQTNVIKTNNNQIQCDLIDVNKTLYTQIHCQQISQLKLEQLSNQAKTNFEKKLLVDALLNQSTLINYNQNRHHAVFMKSYIKFEMGESKESLKLVTTLIEEKTDDIDCYNLKAIILLNKSINEKDKDKDKLQTDAQQLTIKAIILKNQDYNSHFLKGVCLFNLNKITQNSLNLNQIKQIKKDLLQALECFKLEQIQQQKNLLISNLVRKQFNNKKQYLDQINIAFLIDKSVDLINLNKHEEAISYLDKALVIKPNNVVTFLFKCDALMRLKKPEEAIPQLDQALAIQPNNISALLHKGSAQHQLNKLEESISCFDKVKKLDSLNIIALKKIIAIYNSNQWKLNNNY